MATTIFGHRGCPAHEPGNSPAGFRYALTHGAEDYLSLSIWGGYDAKPKGADQSFGQIFK